MMHRHPQLFLAVALGLLCALQACAPLVVGTAAVGGALVALDRRTPGAQVDDQGIELKVPRRVGQVLSDRGHVNATSYNRLVLLTGEVPNDADKHAVEQAIARIENVRGVINELAVTAESSAGSKSNDLLLTGKVKATLMNAPDLMVSTIKVVTERGAVYLMGRVTEREAARASELVRTIPGVLRVVRVFETMSEEELRRIRNNIAATAVTPAPAPAPAMAASAAPAPASR